MQTRGFAAEAEIEPPLKLYGLPGRYASALFVAAAKANALPTVETELNLVRMPGTCAFLFSIEARVLSHGPPS